MQSTQLGGPYATGRFELEAGEEKISLSYTLSFRQIGRGEVVPLHPQGIGRRERSFLHPSALDKVIEGGRGEVKITGSHPNLPRVLTSTHRELAGGRGVS